MGLKSNTGKIIIGKDPKTGDAYLGSIKLKDFYIKIGNDIVYQPIPDKTKISSDIGFGIPTSSTEGYVGKVSIDSSGNAYMCVGVSGSTYTWKQIMLTSI